MYTWGYLVDSALHKMDMDRNNAVHRAIVNKFPYLANEVITQVCSAIKPKPAFAQFIIADEDVGALQTMPNDFISFGDDVNLYVKNGVSEEAHDDLVVYRGHNQLMFLASGIYQISYNARWYVFSTSESYDNQINVPADILDCIPSYIAAECMKEDDLYRASQYRNEYETFLARIDDTEYRMTKTLKIGGDW